MEISNRVERQSPSTTLDLCTHAGPWAANFDRLLACAVLGSEVAPQALHLGAERLTQVVLVLAERAGGALQLPLCSLAGRGFAPNRRLCRPVLHLRCARVSYFLGQPRLIGRGTRNAQTERRRSAGVLLNISTPSWSQRHSKIVGLNYTDSANRMFPSEHIVRPVYIAVLIGRKPQESRLHESRADFCVPS
jgi:hypothetical protein